MKGKKYIAWILSTMLLLSAFYMPVKAAPQWTAEIEEMESITAESEEMQARVVPRTEQTEDFGTEGDSAEENLEKSLSEKISEEYFKEETKTNEAPEAVFQTETVEKLEIESEPAGGAESELGDESGSAAESEPGDESESAAESEPGDELESAAESEPESIPESELESSDKNDMELDSQIKSDTIEIPETSEAELQVLEDPEVVAAEINDGISLLAEEEPLGAFAIIQNVRNAVRITGTQPWDNTDGGGNDSSADNNVVRSFDQIYYDFELAIAMKPDCGFTKIYGGKIFAEAVIPGHVDAVWHADAFQWMAEMELSEDGKTIRGYYAVNSGVQAAPGLQTLNFLIDVKACADQTFIQPAFRFYLETNEESEYRDYVDEAILVTASPRYNAELMWDKETPAYRGMEIELNGMKNKIYNVGFGFQLYGENPEKGLKGVELPAGAVEFDITASLIKKAHEEDSFGIDVTDGNITFLSAKPNSRNIIQEDLTNPECFDILNDLATYAKFSTHQPLSYGRDVFQTIERNKAVYHNGGLSLETDGNRVHITIKDYAIDGIFPYQWASTGLISQHDYTDNIGYISAGNLFYAVELNEETYSSPDSNCYLSFELSNVSAMGISGQVGIADVISEDNRASTMHVEYSEGLIGVANFIYSIPLEDKRNEGVMMESEYTNGDARTVAGATVGLRSEISLDASNPLKYAGYSMNILCKFDDECFEPILYEDQSEYAMYQEQFQYSEDILFNLLYAGKKDWSGWVSDDEMMETDMSDLVYFDTLSELKQGGYVCVGVMYESISGVLKPGGVARLCVPMHIKETSEKDQVYQFLQNARIWGKEQTLDRDSQSFLNPDAVYPDPSFNIKPRYQKATYDKSGNIVDGHKPGYHQGNSLLIVGGITSIKKSVSDIDIDGAKKSVYDLKNMEDRVNYELYPSFTSETDLSAAADVTDDVEVVDYLPEGLIYVEGSSSYGEPEIERMGDGTAKLRWSILGWKINTAAQPIYYSAEIDKTSLSGTQYKNKAVIHAAKTDNSAEVFRSDSYTITVINLAGHRIYKEVSKECIQPDEAIEYELGYLNLTEQRAGGQVILDILPYNGDLRGSSFHGNYQIQKLIPEKKKEETHYQIYGSSSPNVRNADAATVNIGDGSWVLLGDENGEIEVEAELTGICVIGDFAPYEEVKIGVVLALQGCQDGDIYYNDFTMRVSSESTLIQTVPVVTRVEQYSITAIKQLKMSDIYEPFGIPVFFFCLEGVGDSGKTTTYYKSVIFSEEEIAANMDENGIVRISAVFDGLSAGQYYLREQETLRYKLEAIAEVSENGSAEDGVVLFQLGEARSGQAVFLNKIERWDKLTHDCYIINEIGKDS